MSIEYDHSQNLHTLEGPKSAFQILFPDGMPESILDVGCGTGTWLLAANDLGVTDVFGIDGVNIPPEKLLFDSNRFKRCDLTTPVDLGRKFSLVVCMEVAEHIDVEFAPTIIKTLTQHSDRIIFSAACPVLQGGQHHVNCQWPEYWQELFNREGFICEDSLRLKIWNDRRIEVWYRQNMFLAYRNPNAGKEARIRSLIHPEMYSIMAARAAVSQIGKGWMPVRWYLKATTKAIIRKVKRHLL
jgi:SAM-dependent methyltransferase